MNAESMNRITVLMLTLLVASLLWSCTAHQEKPDETAGEEPISVEDESSSGEESLPVEEEAPPGEGEEYPQFPWPPPKASGMAEIPRAFFSNTSDSTLRLADVNRQIMEALEACGYSEHSYFAVPGEGFALVTRIEQINADGTPKSEPDRWSVVVSAMQHFSLAEYLRALFTANTGFFRVIVFVATSTPFTQDTTTVSRETAMSWLTSGMNRLPAEIAEGVFDRRFACHALIYEFEHPRVEEQALLKIPGRMPGKMHLQKAQLWNMLEQ